MRRRLVRCGEVVFEFGGSGLEGLVVTAVLLDGGGEFGVGVGEFVDAVMQVGFGKVVEAGAEGAPQLLLLLVAFGA